MVEMDAWTYACSNGELGVAVRAALSSRSRRRGCAAPPQAEAVRSELSYKQLFGLTLKLT